MSAIDDMMAQFQLSDEERRKIMIQNALLGLGAGLMSSGKGKGSWLNSAGQGMLLGAQMGQNAVQDARAAKVSDFKMRAMLDEQQRKDADLKRKMAFGQSMTNTATEPMGPPSPNGAPIAPTAPNSTHEFLLNMGVPPQVIAAAAQSADPPAAFSKLVDEYRKPFFGAGKLPMLPTREGGFRTVVPEGHNAALYAQTAAETGATEDVKAQYDMVRVPQSDGSERMMTKAQAAEYFARQGTPQGQNAAVNLYSGPTTATPKREPTQAELAWMKSQMPSGATLGQSASPLAIKSGESQIEITGAAAKESNADFIKNSYRPIVDQGVSAKASNAGLDMIDRLPISDQTGFTAPMQLLGARVLTGMGIAPEQAKQFASQGEMFTRAVMTRNWEILNTAKGVQTEGDSQRALKTDQNLANTPGYNQWVRDFTRATNNLKIKQAEFYSKNYAEALRGGNAAQLEATWAQTAPSVWDDPALKKWKSYGETKKNDAPLTPAEQAELDAYRKRRGSPQ